MIHPMLEKYKHLPEEFPVLARQTHRVLRGNQIVSELININENLMHYIRDTALLISIIDGTVEGDGLPYDHVIYLDKSARPVSWLVNMLWDSFAKKSNAGVPVKRPPHTYVNIDRSPWFRHVGINVSEDGRKRDDGELATYTDFFKNIGNLSKQHIAALHAVFIAGGLECENVDEILSNRTILDGKRVLVVDEVSRTGSTLKIAVKLIQTALQQCKVIEGTYFWHPDEPPLKAGSENILTSLPVWYDPATLTGRGIGGINEDFYRKRFEHYLALWEEGSSIDIKKLRKQAFSAPVLSAPLLNPDGTVLSLELEKRTRALCKDLNKLVNDYRSGNVFFTPPLQWAKTGRMAAEIEKQGIKVIKPEMTDYERASVRNDPLFYLNFVAQIKAL